ncbi:MAG: heparan-alpha-glucosaminide N-acetyltransferase, partial [Burkholderiaceae bacterium]
LGYLQQDFYNGPLWTTQRSAILSLFLFCAGLGQSVAAARGQHASRFWQRWRQVAAAALLVSLGSWLMFPRSFIHFGVLHGIALMLIVARLSARLRTTSLLLAGVLATLVWVLGAWLLQGNPAQHFFNSPWLNWLGIVTRKPVTEDYVPLLPWLAVVWWGMAAGQWLQAHHPGVLAWEAGRMGTRLAALGRWSLSFYLLHQPVLLAGLLLTRVLTRS